MTAARPCGSMYSSLTPTGTRRPPSALFDALWRRGLRVFLDTKTLRPWEFWDGVLLAAQTASTVTAVIISEHTGRDFYRRDEVASAARVAVSGPPGRRVVPVYLGRSVGPVPHELRRVQSLSAAEGWGPVADAVVGLFVQAAEESPVLAGPRVWSSQVPLLPRVTMPRSSTLGRLDESGSRLAHTLVGPGGVGKSMTAALYVWQCRQADGVDVVWWVRAQDPLTMVADLADLAPRIGVPTIGLDVETVAEKVRQWLETAPERWVLVLDDAASPDVVERWLPTTGSGRVIITSRDHGWASVAEQTTVPPFDRPTTIEFLADRVRDANPDAADDATGLGRVAARLGGLPLALEQAASFVARPGRTWASYSRLLNEASETSASATGSVGHEATATTTSRVSIAAANGAAPLAGHLLAACGFMASDAIPVDLFVDRAAVTDPYLAATVNEVEGGLDALYDHALATPHTGTLSVHRVVQAAARDRAPVDALDFVARTLCRHFPDPEVPANWPRCAELAPHVLAAARSAGQFPLAYSRELWWALDDVATYHRSAGNTRDAVALHEAALKLARDTMPPGDLNLLTARNNLALTYQAAGRADDAIRLQEQVLADRERLQGTDHPDTLSARINLAGYYAEAGRTDDAIALQQEILAESERLYGNDHLETLGARNNLAAFYYRAEDRIDEAITLQQQVLADCEQVLGPDHPDTLLARDNLAGYYVAAGRTSEAIELQEQVLADRERLLGPDHPDTLTARSTLADSYQDAGRTDEALALQQEVLADRERVLGADHPDTLSTAATVTTLEA